MVFKKVKVVKCLIYHGPSWISFKNFISKNCLLFELLFIDCEFCFRRFPQHIPNSPLNHFIAITAIQMPELNINSVWAI